MRIRSPDVMGFFQRISDCGNAGVVINTSFRHHFFLLQHFLSYLNSLRVKEYCTAIHNLFHYFDRLNRKSSQNVPANTKGKRDEYIRRYAALNLASLQYRFGHK